MKINLNLLVPNPEQPRMTIDQKELTGLAESIKEHGLLNPISVEGPTSEGKYIILDGERRWRAHKMAGLEEIEVYVARSSLNGSGNIERLMLGVIGNLQRQDMNLIERATCYKRLRDLGLNSAEIGKIANMSASMIGVNINLQNIPLEIQGLYAEGKLPFDSRLTKVWIDFDPDKAIRLARRAAASGMPIKRILYLAKQIGVIHPDLESYPRNPEQEKVARANVVFNAKSEFGHWNALAQLMIGKVTISDAKIKTAAISTCKACALYDDASQNVCRDCPAVELIRRLNGTS